MSNTTTTTVTNTVESLRFLEDDFLPFSPIIDTSKILISSSSNNLNINSDFEFIQEIDYSEIDSFFKNNNNNNLENGKQINSSSNNTIYELEPDEELTVDENDINFYDEEIEKPSEFNNYMNINIPLPDLILSDPVSDFSSAPSSADSETFNENIENFKIISNNKDTNLFNKFINSSPSRVSSSSKLGFRDINKMNIKIKKRSKSAVDIPIFNSDIQLKLLSDEKNFHIKDELISPILNKNIEFRKFKSSSNVLSYRSDSNITTNTNTTATTTTTTTNNTTTTTTIASNPLYRPPAILRRLSEADGYKISKHYKKFNTRKLN
ncbi:unnamed protein product [[Candida] boidinii]|nr:hypothetical protein BVG19_g2326 [[Candida] boidinii]OWB48908.1 hypothetical protein B5S27_g445 [[Candida] boidinii]OWB82204.1 hypothetical protein B5S33_g826 [[Candida] boidinii]GMF12186.1 unnamed protein product [[Candida] boidinii]